MNKYELTLLFPETGEVKEKVVKAILAHVKKVKGEVVKQENWGVKTLAYPINKMTTADYEHFVLSLEPKDQIELDRTLRLTEGIVRYMFIRV